MPARRPCCAAWPGWRRRPRARSSARRRANVGYLAQEPDPRPGETTAAYLRRRTGLAVAEEAMQAALRAVGEHPGQTELEAYDDALARFLALGGDDHDARAPRCWPTSASTRPSRGPPGAAVGRPAVKAGLAAVLLARFDVLLLDEPTNNLDFDGLARLSGSWPARSARSCWSATTAPSCRPPPPGSPSGPAQPPPGHLWRRRPMWRSAAAGASRPTPTTTRPGPSGPAGGGGPPEAGVGVSRRGERRTDNDKALAGRRKERATAGATKAKAIERRLERLGDPEKPWEGWDLRLSLQAGRRSGEVVASLAGAVAGHGHAGSTVDLELAATTAT